MKRAFDTLLLNAVDELGDGLLIISFEGEIVYANAFLLTFLGYAHAEIVSKKIWQIDNEINTRARFEQTRDEGLGHFETFYRGKSGECFPVEVSLNVHMMGDEICAVAFIRDIRERKAREAKVSLFHDLLDESHDMIFIIRIDNGHIDYANRSAQVMTGYSLEEMNAIGIEGFRRPLKKDEAFLEHLEELRKRERLTDYAMVIRKDGTEFPVEANVRYVRRDGVDYNIAIVRDITERMEAQQSLQEVNRALEAAVNAKTVELQKNVAFLQGHKQAMDARNIVSKSDLKGRITYVNDNFCKVTGYTREEVIGQPHSVVRHPDSDSAIFKELWSTIQSKKRWQGILKNRKKDGSRYWIDVTIVPILDENGDIFEYIAIRHDITELVEQRHMLEKVAKTDALTGLGNRYKLLNDIQHVDKPSLALIDLDNFSEINDFYGHAFGDLLIIEVANTIEKLISDYSAKQLYRLQGDEFAILNITLSPEAFIQKIEQIIAYVRVATYTIYEEEISVQITASLSFEANRNALFITANMAMKSAKKKQQNMLVYDAALCLDAEHENNIKWTKKLQSAIRNDKLVPYYQPIVNTATGIWEKYECLVRMIDEDEKVISPFFFLDIAKRTKHYQSLTKTVIRKSFDTFSELDQEFSINLTIRDIMEADTQNYIFEMLEHYRIGERVVFEIVESEGIENYAEVIEFISNVKACGCKIAIDDFGTGYANFEYLLKLKADYIKIDGSLIKNLKNDESARVLVANIVSFAKELGILTIAEFVEDELLYEIVKTMGIDYAQGYYFCEPKAYPAPEE